VFNFLTLGSIDEEPRERWILKFFYLHSGF